MLRRSPIPNKNRRSTLRQLCESVAEPEVPLQAYVWGYTWANRNGRPQRGGDSVPPKRGRRIELGLSFRNSQSSFGSSFGLWRSHAGTCGLGSERRSWLLKRTSASLGVCPRIAANLSETEESPQAYAGR
jgi:hypothetical protein